MTTTETVDKPDTDVSNSNTDEPNKVFHYVRETEMIKSIVSGNHVVALCGETFPVSRAAKPGSPVCPDCDRLYKKLPA